VRAFIMSDYSEICNAANARVASPRLWVSLQSCARCFVGRECAYTSHSAVDWIKLLYFSGNTLKIIVHNFTISLSLTVIESVSGV